MTLIRGKSPGVVAFGRWFCGLSKCRAPNDPETGAWLRCGYAPAMDIAAKIIELLSERAPTASICPSDAARALADDEVAWRALMPAVRESAAALARSGRIVITQGDRQLDPDDRYKGPVRLRRGHTFIQD